MSVNCWRFTGVSLTIKSRLRPIPEFGPFHDFGRLLGVAAAILAKKRWRYGFGLVTADQPTLIWLRRHNRSNSSTTRTVVLHSNSFLLSMCEYRLAALMYGAAGMSCVDR